MNDAAGEGLALFLGLLAIHAVLLRFWGNRRYVSRALGLFVVAWLGWCLWARPSLERGWAVSVTFGLLWAMMMTVVVNLVNSVSLRMVRTLMEASGGSLPRADFLARFSDDGNLGARLELLVRNRLLEEVSSGKVRITSSGRKLALLFAGVQRAFRITWVG